MLQWLCLYTLGSRGSQELKTFLEICLISSRIDQKLKNKGRNTSVFKEKISQKSWAIEAIVGADSRRRGGGFTWRHRSFWIGLEWVTISLQKRASIAARSGYDRASIVPSILDQRPSDEVKDECRRFRDERAPLWRWMRHDRTLIGPRSRVDRGSSLITIHRPMAISR